MGVLAWFPQPTLLKCGDVLVTAHELLVRNLATLEAFAVACLGTPLDGLHDDADDYPDKLRAAYDAALTWPPEIGSPEVDRAVFSSPEGIKLFLTLVLRDTPQDVIASLVGTIAQDEFSAIEQVAWGSQPGDLYHREVVGRIDRHLGLPGFAPRSDDDDEPMTGTPWSKAIGEVVANHGWASPEAVGNLTLSQWRMVRCGGDTGEREDPLPSDPKLNDRVCTARREFFGIVAIGLEPILPDIIDGPELFQASENF